MKSYSNPEKIRHNKRYKRYLEKELRKVTARIKELQRHPTRS